MKKKNVFIVDDEVKVCNLIKEVGEDYNFNFHIVNDGNKFMEKFVDILPDLIFLDLNLPGKDGVELLTSMRHVTNKPKIVLMSGTDVATLSSVGKLGEMHNINIIHSFQKPFELDELEEVFASLSSPKEVSFKINKKSILSGLKNNEFSVCYQPKMNVKNFGDSTFAGCEALCRWNHPKFGHIPPQQFISLAEDQGVIEELTDFVFQQCLQDMQTWSDQGFDFNVSVNISQLLLADYDFSNKYEKMINASSIRPENITFEITETGIMSDPAASLEVMSRLRLKGFKLSLDDFGTGYSSVAHLYRMPVNELKVDRMFVKDICQDEEALNIVKFMIGLANSMGVGVCIEGVEDESSLLSILNGKLMQIQGYYFSKPLPASQVTSFIHKSQVSYKSTGLGSAMSSC